MKAPLMRALPHEDKWLLEESWPVNVRMDRRAFLRRAGAAVATSAFMAVPDIPLGYRWDGASKPLHDKAFLVLPSSHWRVVVPTLEHDWLCDNRETVSALGIDSKLAHLHFLRRCEQYGVSFRHRWMMYLAILFGGPKWT